MHRQDLASRAPASCGGGSQDELVAGDCGSADPDFRLGPWLSALDFLGGSVPCPIGSFRGHRSATRVEHVVGIVCSCWPNGCGDLFVTLKDPTGSIGAYIHRKVLTSSSFGAADFAVGCVLVLKQVVSLSIRSVSYLNVTVNNIVKLICKESGPPERPFLPKSVTSVIGHGAVCKTALSRKDAQRDLDLSPPLDEMVPEFESFDKESEIKEAGFQTSQDSAMRRNVKHKGMPDDSCPQGANRSLPHIFNNSVVASSSTLPKETRAGTLLMPATQQNLKNVAVQCTNQRNSNKDGQRRDAVARQESTLWDATTRELLRDHIIFDDATEAGTVAEESSVLENTSAGLQGHVSTDPKVTTSCRDAGTCTSTSEPKELISKASVIDWTDEQLRELFSDYQDDMDAFTL